MKCKDQREMTEVEKVKMKNGRPAAKGVCAKCGCKMYKILPMSEAQVWMESDGRMEFV